MISASQPTGRVFGLRSHRRSRGHMRTRAFELGRCSGWRLAGLLAVGLSGCADDGFLIREASPVNMPIPPTTPSAVQTPVPAPAQATAEEPGTNTVPAREGQSRRYFAAIGRVVLANHAGDDFFSSPDIYVQVQRRDPEVLGSIRRAESRQSALGGQQRAAEAELRPLRTKQQASELTPGEPLSRTQAARLEALTRDLGDACGDSMRRTSCAMCSHYDERPVCVECEACSERRFLEEKKAASEIVPGPALTPEERERLQELESAIERIASDRQATGREIQRLWATITGHTHTITTPGYILEFGDRAIQEVFPGDEVWITVYDRDIDANDLYGTTALRIDDAMLGGGDMELAMRNVRLLIMRIVSP